MNRNALEKALTSNARRLRTLKLARHVRLSALTGLINMMDINCIALGPIHARRGVAVCLLGVPLMASKALGGERLLHCEDPAPIRIALPDRQWSDAVGASDVLPLAGLAGVGMVGLDRNSAEIVVLGPSMRAMYSASSVEFDVSSLAYSPRVRVAMCSDNSIEVSGEAYSGPLESTVLSLLPWTGRLSLIRRESGPTRHGVFGIVGCLGGDPWLVNSYSVYASSVGSSRELLNKLQTPQHTVLKCDDAVRLQRNALATLIRPFYPARALPNGAPAESHAPLIVVFETDGSFVEYELPDVLIGGRLAMLDDNHGFVCADSGMSTLFCLAQRHSWPVKLPDGKCRALWSSESTLYLAYSDDARWVARVVVTLPCGLH